MDPPFDHPQIAMRSLSSCGYCAKELIERCELIFQLDRAELMSDRGLKFAVAARGSAIVDGENRETLPRQNFIKRIRRFFQHGLRRRSAVDIHDQRNFAAGRGIRRQQQSSVKSGAIVRFELQKFRSAQSVLRNIIARLPYWKALPLPRRTATSAVP